MWNVTHRADARAALIADRHYNRQKIGALQFVPPGRCVVLHAEHSAGRALWVTSWPFAEYVRHEWAGAWVCSLFRNEGAGIASDLIRDALAATQYEFGEPPELGLVTFIDRRFVRPTMVRGREVFGWTWLRAGFREIGETKGGLLALGISPEAMPAAVPAFGAQGRLQEVAHGRG